MFTRSKTLPVSSEARKGLGNFENGDDRCRSSWLDHGQ